MEVKSKGNACVILRLNMINVKAVVDFWIVQEEADFYLNWYQGIVLRIPGY